MTLPNRLFFTGCPGSRWSGIAQDLEKLTGVNTSDHSADREYKHGKFAGHKGAYFGQGMEFLPILDSVHLDKPWDDSLGMKIVKSHDWAYKLRNIKHSFPKDWIMLVYRPDMASYTWWVQAGGFDISYPSYAAFKDYDAIHTEIVEQNKAILQFSQEQGATWNHYSNKWIKDTFGQDVPPINPVADILVTVIK